MAEAVSAGTAVMATSFPFAEELAAAYPYHVHVENELAVWPKALGRLIEAPLKPAPIPGWEAMVGAVEAAVQLAQGAQLSM